MTGAPKTPHPRDGENFAGFKDCIMVDVPTPMERHSKFFKLGRSLPDQGR